MHAQLGIVLETSCPLDARRSRAPEVPDVVRLLATELRMTDYVLTGLVKRRAELAGEIEATHDRLRRMIEDLEKLDSVILQFDPSYQVNHVWRQAVGVLRMARTVGPRCVGRL
jgi:hypothetical protein